MFNWIRRNNPASSLRPKCRPQVESLEDRCLLSAATAPVISAISDGSLPSGGVLYVPVIASDGNGSLVDYTATSSDPNVTVSVRSGFAYLDVKVQGMGDMIFQIYSDIAPNTSAIISTLVTQGFYTNLTFHRVVSGFVIQGGDPNGDGTGGPGFTFENEVDGVFSDFNGTGQLAMANSGGTDTNGSQFFSTIGPQTSLNGNYTLFGQLVRGFDVENEIAQVPVDSNDKPLTPVVIQSATIIADYTDTVLQIQAPAGYNGDPNITVTGTSAGGVSTQSFHVQVGDGGVALQNIQFVNRAFSTILDRPAEQSAVNYYSDQLATNQMTTSQIASQIQTSLESRVDEVKNAYQTLLNRAPDPTALQSNTLFLMNGGTVQQLEANIVASQEYFEAQGGTNAAWITALFKASTGATSVPLYYSTQVSSMLDTGLTRNSYAESIYSSLSADAFTVQNLFNQFLARTPTTAQVLPLAQVLNSGVSEDDIVVTIVASDEFFNFTKNQKAGTST